MAEYVFKVQVFLPGNVSETVILRQYIDKVDRCFDRFKTNLIQRYDILTNTSFKMMWTDNDGDKISIFNEEDLRTFIELKGTKIVVEVDGASKPSVEKTTSTENRSSIPPSSIFRSFRRPERGWIMGDGRYQTQNDHEINGNNTSPTNGTNPQPAIHAGVQCDGCDSDIRGYRYKCIECADFDLCFSCEMKKLHGDHMMLRIVKPLDRPFNRHFLKTMMRQRCCEGKGREKRGRYQTVGQTFPLFNDIVTDIANNISSQCTTKPSNEENQNSEQNRNKSNPIDPIQYTLNSETFAKAGEVLSNLAQHFASVMDPFSVHEFIPTTQTNVDSKQNEAGKANEPQKAADESHDKNLETKIDTVPSAVSTSSTSNTPTVSSTSVPVDPPKEQVTIEDVIEPPSAPRGSSPSAIDWALVDVSDLEDDISERAKTIQKTSAVQTPSSVGSVDGAAALPNYAVLARDLEDHLHHTLRSQAVQTPPQMPIMHHANPKINEAIVTMTSMGFSNGGGWLTRLLENVNGDIPKALEKLHPSH